MAVGSVVLASSSLARRRMLENVGVRVVAARHLVDERAVEATVVERGGSGRDVAIALASAKSKSILDRYAAGQTIVGSDQVVIWAGALLSKPESVAEARDRLWSMRADTHELVSAVSIRKGDCEEIVARSAFVRLRAFSEAALDSVIAADPAMATGSAAGYAIEAAGAQLVEAVEGDHTTILGMPLYDVLRVLRGLGHLPE